MTPFSYLLIAHLIGDYLFQTSWMAMNKHAKWLPLFVHSFVYTAVIAIASFVAFEGLSWWAILFVFVTHVIVDRRTIVLWWVKNIMRTDPKQVGWLVIMVDQVFHIIVLAVALHI